ncbi:MAG: hypothetical protein WCL57_07530, partial [Chloroflexota bacterium]
INRASACPALIPASQPVKVAEETAVPREIINLETTRPIDPKQLANCTHIIHSYTFPELVNRNQ